MFFCLLRFHLIQCDAIFDPIVEIDNKTPSNNANLSRIQKDSGESLVFYSFFVYIGVFSLLNVQKKNNIAHFWLIWYQFRLKQHPKCTQKYNRLFVTVLRQLVMEDAAKINKTTHSFNTNNAEFWYESKLIWMILKRILIHKDILVARLFLMAFCLSFNQTQRGTFLRVSQFGFRTPIVKNCSQNRSISKISSNQSITT